MNVMGIFLTSNVLRIVTLSGTKEKHSRIQESFHKIEIPKDNNYESVRLIIRTLKAFWIQNQIDAIGIYGRATSGQAAGGCLTFKSEGLLLGISEKEIKTIFSATIRATDRKRVDDKISRPSTKDLGIAYDVAFEMLPE